jgi:hypothetical protein
MIIDGTECPINRPQNSHLQKVYYSGKSRTSHSVNYQVGISLINPQLVWCSGPEPGSVHDLTAARRSGLFRRLLRGERVLGDMGYMGHPRTVTPLKKNCKRFSASYRIWFNKLLGKLRVRVEHILHRIKVFECFIRPWRHNLKFHRIAFHVAINIMSIETKFFPLHKKP